ncbi:WD40-repeat-containing domain protein [Dichotomocladium elegans]|nr:WD40-repeat-containing domain protein [Dichotomocladium elegans]
MKYHHLSDVVPWELWTYVCAKSQRATSRETYNYEIPIASTRAHNTIINMVAGSVPEFLTCSRDGLVKAWDARDLEKPVFTVRHDSPKDAWSVAFGGESKKIVGVGFDNGDFELYDLRTAQYMWKTNVGSGICSIEFADSNTAVLSTLKGLHIVQFDREPVIQTLKTFNDTTMWATSHLPQNPRYFGAVSGDGMFRVWDHQNTGQPVAAQQLEKHPIVSCSWNHEKKGLFACGSFAQTIKVGFAQI